MLELETVVSDRVEPGNQTGVCPLGKQPVILPLALSPDLLYELRLINLKCPLTEAFSFVAFPMVYCMRRLLLWLEGFSWHCELHFKYYLVGIA